VTQALFDWLTVNQQWIFIAAFISSFVESLAIIGVLVPGVALLFGIALVAASSGVALEPLLVATFAGAIVGDCLSFFIGRHYHENLRHYPPFTSHPHWVKKGEKFFLKRGVISIVLGRFIGPLRPLIPLIAGMFQMPPATFVSVNVLSAIAWAPTYIVRGFLVGLSMDDSYGLQWQHTLAIASLVLLIWCINILIHKGFARAKENEPQSSTIQSTIQSTKIGLSIFAYCGFLFVALSLAVTWGWMDNINNWVHTQFLMIRHPWIDPVFIAITEFGSFKPMALCGSLIVIFFLAQRWWSTAACWLAILASSPIIIFGLKHFFGIARPNAIAVPPESLAFPSGHATMIMLFGGFMALILVRHANAKYHRKITQFFVALISLVAVSRLYLGVHWFSDVVGGLILASAILGLAHTIYLQFTETIVPFTKAVAGVSIAMLISIGVCVIPNHEQSLLKFKPLDSTTMNAAYQQHFTNKQNAPDNQSN